MDAMDSVCGQTLDDVKKLVNKQVRSGTISRTEAGHVVKKWKMREKRRVGRQTDKQTAQFCYACRQSGHKVSDCPNSSEKDFNSGLCFKCGSTEHTSSKCPRKNVKGFPYASCFICKKQGHLSRDCPDNSKGIYPDGGSCNVCGSQMHLRKDCPTLQQKSADKEAKEVALVEQGSDVGGDEDVVVKKPKVTKKGPRRVKF
ncbi:hypothetical protein QR680_006528 [Steinernema hermaphroditum]|uniref:CCHC-type domain-containing protein n=1 Tax=Steinernema hermaphroditum TaxID=289476 RepID=A0AA39HX10_9BILA|nr:hypothetical protein QR680_006528 [Steinernema hermaphroditum]